MEPTQALDRPSGSMRSMKLEDEVGPIGVFPCRVARSSLGTTAGVDDPSHPTCRAMPTAPVLLMDGAIL